MIAPFPYFITGIVVGVCFTIVAMVIFFLDNWGPK